MKYTSRKKKNYILMKKKLVGLYETFFPQICLSCEKLTSNNDLFDLVCNSCLKLVMLQEPCCANCHKKNSDFRLCFNCSKEFYLDGIIFASKFKNPILNLLIKEFKYKGFKSIARILAYLIKSQLQKIDFDVKRKILIPVPLDKYKLKERGFNQNILIADILKKQLKIKIADLIIKKVPNIAQAKLANKSLRLQNVKNVFKIRNDKNLLNIKTKEVLLLDDVCTTGSTLNECAKILRKNGFKNIWGLVIAKD